MRIGVTGAFGFLGANFVAELLSGRAGKVEVVAFASRTRANPLFDPRAVETRPLDIMDGAAMARSFAGLDAVAHFAGKVDYLASHRRAVWEANVVGASRVFDAVLEAGVPRLLYVSSVSALGEPPEGSLADEASSPYGNPHYPISFPDSAAALAAVDASLRGDYSFLRKVRVAYLDSKLAGRELAARYARERGLPVVSVYPGTAVGAGDLHYAISSLVDNVWDGRLRLSVGGATSFVDAADFASGARLALERGKPGEGYVISGRDEHNLSYVDFMRLVSAVARANGGPGSKAPFAVPALPAVVAGAIVERVAPAAGLSSALTLSGEARNVCSSARAVRELGYAPREDLSGSILACRRFAEAGRAAKA